MNETQQNVTAHKNARNALQRVEGLEQMLTGLIGSISKVTGNLGNRLDKHQAQLSAVVEVLDAVVKILGPEEVQKRVVEERVLVAQQQAEANKASIKKGVEDGRLKAVDTISNKTLIVGKELKSDGTVAEPGFILLTLATLEKEEDRNALNGQKVGFQLATPVGNTFEVVEIYEPVETPVPAPEAAPVAEATPEKTEEATSQS